MSEAPVGRSPFAARVPEVTVTVVVVTCGGSDFLSRTLGALAVQARPPQRVVLVDANAEPDPELARQVRRHWPGRARGVPLVVAAPGARTFGDAVRAGLQALPDAAAPPGEGPAGQAWVWLLHDDSAPEPAALAELLHAVEIAPSVGIAGCKQHTWSDPRLVLQAGVWTSRFGRRMNGIDVGEPDQGQHDGQDDVLAVSTAGALVRRDVWDALGGTDPALGPYGDGLDLCRRARLAGHRVVVVPAAVVRHARASLSGTRPGWDAGRSARAQREAFLHSQLAGVPAPLVPVVALLAVGSGVLRAVARAASKDLRLVLGELLVPWEVLGRPGLVRSARRRAKATRLLPRRALRPLQAGVGEVVRQVRERRLSAAEHRRTRYAPSELELAELASLRRRRRAALGLVLLGAIALTAAVAGPLISRVVGGARLAGPMPFGEADLGELWRAATSWWASGGFGTPSPPEPLLAVLAPLTALVGSVGTAAALLLLCAPVLAAAGAWFASGAATRSVLVRAWAALVWAAAPALLVGLQQGRLGTVLAHVAIPWFALGVARGVGVARVDMVESGLVGAARAPGAADVVATRTRVAEPSLAAIGGAAVAFVVLTAAAPVLLPAGLVVLAAVAVVVRRRLRLIWVGLPALVLAGPMIAEAVGRWSAGGWRLLVAEPFAVAGDPAPVWQQVLGWPAPLPSGPGGVPSDLVGGALLAGGAVLLVLGAASLLTPVPRVRAVRVAWIGVAAGIGSAVLATRVVSGVDGDGFVVTGSAAPGLSLALAGLLTAALAGSVGLGANRSAAPRWRRVSVVVVAAVAVLGPAATLGLWTWEHRGGSGLDVSATDVPVVPAVGRQMQGSPDRVRMLAVEVVDGEVVAQVFSEDGQQLTETSRVVQLGPVLSEVVDPAHEQLAGLAARLAVGSSQDISEGLGSLGIGAVLVPAGEGDAHALLVGRLDATPGLERMTETESGVIWRVALGQHASAAWARLVRADGETLLEVLPARQGEPIEVPEGTGQRLLVLAERADPGWRASLDGQPLRATASSWRQAFELGPEAGSLVIEHSPAGRRWLPLQAAVLAVTVLLAVPTRRRRGAGQ